MSALNELVSQIEDPTLRARIEAEVDRLAKRIRGTFYSWDSVVDYIP